MYLKRKYMERHEKELDSNIALTGDNYIFIMDMQAVKMIKVV